MTVVVPFASAPEPDQKVSADTVQRLKHSLMQSADEYSLTKSACQLLTEVGCFCFAWIGYPEHQNDDQIQPVSYAGKNRCSLNETILSQGNVKFSHEASEQARRTAEAVISNEINSHSNKRTKCETNDRYNKCISITLPILHDSEFLGALSIYSTEEGAFDIESRRHLAEIVNYIAFSIMSLRNRPQAEVSHNQMVALIERNPDAILILDVGGNVEFANPSAEALLGKSAEQLKGTPLGLPLTIGETTEIEILSRHEDGAIEPRIVEYRLIDFSSMQGHKTLAFLHDITETRMAEQLEMRMGRILEHSWNEIYLFNEESLRFIDISSGGLQHLGYSHDELQQMTPVDIIPGFSYERFEALLLPLRNDEQQELSFESEHRCKDGSCYPVEIRLQLAREESPRVFIAIVQDISERKSYIAELEHKALYDPLTELPNRSLLHDRLTQSLKSVKREDLSLVVLSISVLHMGDINDTLGYHSGDQVLVNVAARLRKVCRDSDTFARSGDNEFIVILKNASVATAQLVASKIQKAMQFPIVVDDVSLEIEIAVGIAVYPDHGANTKMLLQHADIAMRMAKFETVGISVFSYENVPFSLRQLKLHGELRRAIYNNEMAVYYQPKIDIESKTIIGFEALARWVHPREGMVPPDDFIPMVERSGLIRPFTLWVVEKVIAQLDSWNSRGLNLSIAVNLSTRNLLDLELPETIIKLLKRYHVNPNQLYLEITESALMSRPDQAVKIVQQLHDIGLKISIDDFGTGFSSLSYLKKLPVDELKIDQSFIFGLIDSEDDAVIVRSTIDLAHNLGLKTVAEGVERKDVLDELALLQCDTVQGYHMSHPLPVMEIEKWWESCEWSIAKPDQ